MSKPPLIGPVVTSTGAWTIGPLTGMVYHPAASAELIKTKQDFKRWDNDNWKHIDNLLIVLDKLDLL